MRPLRALLTASVPIGIALAAFLDARAVSALVEGAVVTGGVIAEQRSKAPEIATSLRSAKSADAVLDRNPFDHLTGSLRSQAGAEGDRSVAETDPRSAPPCVGVRPLVVVGDEDQKVAFAALEVGGQRVLRRSGGEVGGHRIVYVGRDRVWLEGATGLCQALLFGAPTTHHEDRVAADPLPAQRSAFEIEVAMHIVKTGPNEFQVDRPTVDRILGAQQELMKARLVPDMVGDRTAGMKVYGIKPGSVLATIGIQNADRLETINGFEVANPEKMLEAYARLRLADRLTLNLTRGGQSLTLDYSIR